MMNSQPAMSLSEAYQKSKDFLAERAITLDGKKLLLAVSGGMDSMYMLRMLREAHLNIEVAHLNYQLRGEDSDADLQLVRQECIAMQVTLHEKLVNTTAESLAGESVQLTARRLRYAWFEELRKQHAFDWICTAHHLYDSIETFFVNLMRGTGLKGLTGIPVVRDRILRPMLCFRRSEIHASIRLHNIPFREDASNAEDKYLRNRIRHDLIPVLLRENPSFQTRMAESLDRLNSEHELLRHYLTNLQQEVFTEANGIGEISLTALRKIPVQLPVLHNILRPFGFQWYQCNAILNGSMSTGSQYFSNSHVLVVNRDTLLVTPLPEGNGDAEVSVTGPGEYRVAGGTLTVVRTDRNEVQFHQDSRIECVSGRLFDRRVVLRRWRHGDVIYPFGMEGSQKVQDYFVNQKLSLPAKRAAWILTSGDEIVWLSGLRLDRRFAVGEKDHTCYRLQWSPH